MATYDPVIHEPLLFLLLGSPLESKRNDNKPSQKSLLAQSKCWMQVSNRIRLDLEPKSFFEMACRKVKKETR